MVLKDKVVLITGASDGIGAACAAAFRKRGARLVLTARREHKLREVAAHEELVVPGDLTAAEARRNIVDSTMKRYGKLDVLVNNAGVGLYASTCDASMADVRALFELNFFVPLAMTQLAATVMRPARSGTIVNVGSIAGKIVLPWLTLYSASKHALGAMTSGLRMELMRDGIHLMEVCPGYVNTNFQSHVIAGTPPLAMQRRRPLSVTMEQCAEAIVQGVERNARTVVTPASGWFAIAAARLFPSIAERRLARMHSQTT